MKEELLGHILSFSLILKNLVSNGQRKPLISAKERECCLLIAVSDVVDEILVTKG
jgi:hypothetical protein